MSNFCEIEELYLDIKNVEIRRNVSRRTINALINRLNTRTVREMMELDPVAIMETRQLGIKALKEIFWFRKWAGEWMSR